MSLASSNLGRKVQTDIFARRESSVQSYARSFPSVWKRARGTELWDVNGRRYLDFLAGAGSLNYGHNNPVLKEALLDYIERDGITHSLDLHTAAKERSWRRWRNHPEAARPRLRHAVHRPDRHQRRRSRAEDRAQSHRPHEHHQLHQRLSWRVRWARSPRPATSISAAPPEWRSRRHARCPMTATSAATSTPSRYSRRCSPTRRAGSTSRPR